MKQKDLILEWVKVNGSIMPAKMSGLVFMGHMFGSETSKRCRELRKEGKLLSEPSGKFETFYLPENKVVMNNVSVASEWKEATPSVEVNPYIL